MVHLGDICKINGAEIEPVWVVTGGSPCQDLSIAGKRAGLAGARSGLFMEQVRIVKEMREEDKRNGRTGDMVRPRFLVWENVVGAFSSNKGKDFAAVLEEIARIAEPGFSLSGLPEKWKWTKTGAIDGDGWSIAWRTHDAKDWGKTIRDSRTGGVIRLGTPQRRRRISVVADFGGESAAQIQFDRESVSGHPAESGAAGEGFAGAAESGFNPAVARSLTARADGSPCADRGPNIVLQSASGGVTAEKSGTLGTGNDQTVFCLQGNGIDRADTAGCNGKGWKADESYTLNTIDRPAVCAEVSCMNPWDAQSARVYDQNGVWHSLNANENGGMARDSVLCAGFKLGNSEQARSIGYQEELSPTLNAECGGNKPAVVALDMTHACDVIRECGEQAPSLQARMGTGGNQVPLTYQAVTGTLSPGAHAGSYNGQDAYNDMLVVSSEISPSLRAKGNDPYRADMSAYVASVDCRNFREGGEVNGTLQAKESGQSLNLNNTVRQHMVVRRLTPMECERLQGFPDGWTDIGDWVKTDKRGREIKVKGSADSPRYKALGNSIALPFWAWMLRRMARYLPEGATLGSLFDGIGGFPLIWERIHGKGTARWASEIEPFPIAVTKKWFGEE
jgi:DNA (cytosine-5)-methyltransferase 1